MATAHEAVKTERFCNLSQIVALSRHARQHTCAPMRHLRGRDLGQSWNYLECRLSNGSIAPCLAERRLKGCALVSFVGRLFLDTLKLVNSRMAEKSLTVKLVRGFRNGHIATN